MGPLAALRRFFDRRCHHPERLLTPYLWSNAGLPVVGVRCRGCNSVDRWCRGEWQPEWTVAPGQRPEAR